MLLGHDQRRHAVTPSVPSAYSSTLPDAVDVKLVHRADLRLRPTRRASPRRQTRLKRLKLLTHARRWDRALRVWLRAKGVRGRHVQASKARCSEVCRQTSRKHRAHGTIHRLVRTGWGGVLDRPRGRRCKSKDLRRWTAATCDLWPCDCYSLIYLPLARNAAETACTHAVSARNRTANSPGLFTTVCGCRRKASATTIIATASARAARRKSSRSGNFLSSSRSALSWTRSLAVVIASMVKIGTASSSCARAASRGCCSRSSGRHPRFHHRATVW